MRKNNNILNTSLINISHDRNLIRILETFKLRIFFAGNLYIAWNTDDYKKMSESNTKCTIRVYKGKINFIYATTDSFSILIELKNIDKTHYEVIHVNYYNKSICENQTINKVKRLGLKTPKKIKID